MNKIKENTEIKINVDPIWPPGPSKVLNSWCNVVKILFHMIWDREGTNQYKLGKSRRPINILVQLRDAPKILEVGSKTENKLVIIFN